MAFAGGISTARLASCETLRVFVTTWAMAHGGVIAPTIQLHKAGRMMFVAAVALRIAV
jgi:hypothetical protein